jgi:DNA-binding transcriptional LysR family regulator
MSQFDGPPSLKVLPVASPVRPWLAVAVTLKNRTLSPVVALFIDFLRDFTKPMRAVTGATPLKWNPPERH